ncbi:MAG: hypothetical protein EXS02_02825 [Planctomycetes bacterium]|nr:hypothetical protein [Planctomycetota bacterium]
MLCRRDANCWRLPVWNATQASQLRWRRLEVPGAFSRDAWFVCAPLIQREVFVLAKRRLAFDDRPNRQETKGNLARIYLEQAHA